MRRGSCLTFYALVSRMKSDKCIEGSRVPPGASIMTFHSKLPPGTPMLTLLVDHLAVGSL